MRKGLPRNGKIKNTTFPKMGGKKEKRKRVLFSGFRPVDHPRGVSLLKFNLGYFRWYRSFVRKGRIRGPRDTFLRIPGFVLGFFEGFSYSPKQYNASVLLFDPLNFTTKHFLINRPFRFKFRR